MSLSRIWVRRNFEKRMEEAQNSFLYELGNPGTGL